MGLLRDNDLSDDPDDRGRPDAAAIHWFLDYLVTECEALDMYHTAASIRQARQHALREAAQPCGATH
ncbi:MAG: hypothetical protein H6843_14585 [Rhodospirillaceae bacterium]|nr:hypothetical protein [Rhodospirillaceae bacterium]